MSDPNSNAPQLSLSASAARNLATATLTVPQMQAITPPVAPQAVALG